MRFFRRFSQVIPVRVFIPIPKYMRISISKSRKQELIDLGLFMVIAFLIVVYKVSKA